VIACSSNRFEICC